MHYQQDTSAFSIEFVLIAGLFMILAMAAPIMISRVAQALSAKPGKGGAGSNPQMAVTPDALQTAVNNRNKTFSDDFEAGPPHPDAGRFPVQAVLEFRKSAMILVANTPTRTTTTQTQTQTQTLSPESVPVPMTNALSGTDPAEARTSGPSGPNAITSAIVAVLARTFSWKKEKMTFAYKTLTESLVIKFEPSAEQLSGTAPATEPTKSTWLGSPKLTNVIQGIQATGQFVPYALPLIVLIAAQSLGGPTPVAKGVVASGTITAVVTPLKPKRPDKGKQGQKRYRRKGDRR